MINNIRVLEYYYGYILHCYRNLHCQFSQHFLLVLFCWEKIFFENLLLKIRRQNTIEKIFKKRRLGDKRKTNFSSLLGLRLKKFFNFLFLCVTFVMHCLSKKFFHNDNHWINQNSFFLFFIWILVIILRGGRGKQRKK